MDKNLITIFGTLGVLSASIIFSYSNLPLWSIYIAIPSIVIMLLILVWISPFPQIIREKKDKIRRNKLAKKYFEKFEHDSFVVSFKRIQSSSSDSTYSEHTFHNIVDRLKRNHQEFQSLPTPEIHMIRDRFTFWLRWYGYFGRKIDFNGFSTLLEDFSSMVIEYHRICVNQPLTKISRINEKNEIKIDKEITNDWKTAMRYYDHFEKRYNQFVDEVNGKFKETILPSIPPAQEL